MSLQLASNLIWHLDKHQDMDLGRASKKINKWLEGLDIEMNLLRLLQWNWPRAETQFGQITIYTMKYVMKNDFTNPLLEHRLLQIGAGPNGEFFVLDLMPETAKPCFVDHEVYWDNTERPRSILQPVAKSLTSMLYRIAEGKYVPSDYYATRDFNEYLKNEEGIIY